MLAGRMRVELPCPWADDDELGVEDVTRDAQASVSGRPRTRFYGN